jgi:hypothetical protein
MSVSSRDQVWPETNYRAAIKYLLMAPQKLGDTFG